jgi:hypothetical protein
MSNDKKAKILERVRALLAKADSTTFPAEADAFRSKADKLMVAYTIEQWELAQSNNGNEGSKPVVREVAFTWWLESNRRDELWSLFTSAAKHCRCVVAVRGYKYRSHEIPVIGLNSDLDYMDILFTHLMLQMGKGLEPHVDSDLPLLENLAVMKEAGVKWQRIGELLHEAGQLEEPYSRKVGVRFTKLYKDFCEENNRERNLVSPSVYQRSYAMGFVRELNERFSNMREESQEQSDGEFLPAILDLKKQAENMYDDIFPPTKQNGRAVSRNVKVHAGAYRAGIKDGRKASIASNNKKVKTKSVKAIGA